MRFPFLLSIALLTLPGCGNHAETSSLAVPAAAVQGQSPGEKRAARSPSIAYEHSLHLDVHEDKIGSVYEAVQAACREATADQCVLLESRLDTGDHASATLRLRARPTGIEKLLTLLSIQGGVTHISRTAEDLAQPMADHSRKLAMLHDYRSRLEVLRVRAGSNIDSLIRINKELAQVQNDIEALDGEIARLRQRVETEILNVHLDAVHHRSFMRPVSQALANFTSHLSEGLSSAITGLAYVIPWSIMLFVFAWGAGKLWGRSKRARARHDLGREDR